MTDELNPFENAAGATEANPFENALSHEPQGESSIVGATGRSAVRGALPTGGGLAGAGAGAALGLGAAPMFGPAAPAAPIVGALAGSILGSATVDKVQHWALSKLPDSWREKIGMDDRQEQLDNEQHPIASFIGGVAPYVLTMQPGKIAAGALPPNATALQRVMANPATARVFGGAAMGGIELGQELTSGEDVNWNKVAISTGFGLVFNKPTQLGERITGMGSKPFERFMPTLAQAADAKVMGPGITEAVFQGAHEQDPTAAMTAQDAARAEKAALQEPPEPDLHDIARRMHPDTFAKYDELVGRQADLRKWVEEFKEPPQEHFDDLTKQKADLQERLDGLGNYSGKEGRQIRAQMRDIDNQVAQLNERKAAFAEGRGEETRDSLAARQQLLKTEFELRDLHPEVQAAYRRASDAVGSGTVPPEEAKPAEAPAAEPGARTLDQQKDFIAQDTVRQLVAAGRPVEEAEAAGRLLAARYEARAARLGGKAGTAEELYKAEAPEIRAGRMAIVPKPEPEAKPSETSAVASAAEKPVETAPNVQDRWQSFLDARKGMLSKHIATGGFNGATSRYGVPLRPKSRQTWEVGNVVDVGFVKDVLVTAKNEDGSFSLVGKPDENGQSQSYTQIPQKGITKEGKVDFAEATKDIAPPARELEQSAKGKINFVEGQKPIIALMKNADASTFIHETGHDWLEQLVRDAQHEAAPEGLKSDVDAVKKWLKLEEGDISTRKHEKFARGFEQYMREGTAPSPELASVFSKFKNWLTQIYQTIKGLGAPISDDIRGVFDRMLATEPQRTVIAPERATPSSLADIHEADAAHVESHEADAAADRVAVERTEAAKNPPPEIAHEIEAIRPAAEPAGEASGGASGSSEVDARSGESKPVANGGGMGEGAGKVGGGGSAASAESGGVSKPTGSASRGPTGERAGAQPLEPQPDKLFGPGDPKFVDKAGNIRLENITKNEDVAQVIRETAEQNDDFIGDRRGKVSDQQVLDLADALGMDAKQLNDRRIGQAFNAEQIIAARKLLVDSATDVSERMKLAATGTDQDVLAYAEARDRHQMIQAQVSGITAEAGRALRAFRDISMGGMADVNEFVKGATGKTLFQLRMEARMGAGLDTPAKVSKFLQDAQKRSFGRMILEYWINGLISGPTTHTTYAVGNLILSLEKAGPETAAAAMIGSARNMLGREGERVRFGEVAAKMKGAVQGLPAAVEASLEAAKSGQTTLLPGEQARALTPFAGDTQLVVAKNATNDAVTWKNVGSQLYGMGQGIRDGLISGAALIKAGGEAGAPLVGPSWSPLGQIPDLAFRGVPVLPVGSAIRAPGRMIAAIHSFFRSMNYSMEKGAGAYRIATEEGLTGAAFDARVTDIRQNPTSALMEDWVHESTEATLMGQGGKFVKTLTALTNSEINLPGIGPTPMLKFVMPFVHIASNILDQALVQRTPLGFFSKELHADIMGRNGNIAQDTAMARMLCGTALSITAGTLAAQGYLSGSGPTDPAEGAMWRLAGNQAHSVRIGDIWYDIHKLGPMGLLMSTAADFYDVGHAISEEDGADAAGKIMHAFTQNVLDESFMRGPAELLRAIEDHNRYGAQYVRNFLSSFTPFSVGSAQIARAMDPYSRQARTTMDAIKNKIPGMSETLLPRRDIWGEPIANKEAMGGKGVTAVYAVQMSKDPVNQAMVELGIHPAPVKRSIRNVDLTDEQYDDYARIAGRMTKQRLDVFVNSPDFARLPNFEKVKLIEATVTANREAAAGMLMMKNPSIAQQAYKQKMEQFKD